MASRKSKLASVRKAGQRGYMLYLPLWIVKRFSLEPGDQFEVQGEDKTEIKLILEGTSGNSGTDDRE